MQVTDTLGRYDFIFGRDYMARYGIDVWFSDKTIRWDGTKMEMHSTGYWTKDLVEERLQQVGQPSQTLEPVTVPQDELLDNVLSDPYKQRC